MPPFLYVGAVLVVYVLTARLCLSIPQLALRAWAFAATNIGAYISLTMLFGGSERVDLLALCAAYVLLVVISFLLMTLGAKRDDWVPWLAFAFPILVLVFVKYLPFLWLGILTRVGISKSMVVVAVVGLSYMAFRLSHLTLELREGAVAKPSMGEYLGFAFFLPTMVLGPINPYSLHQRSFAAPDRSAMPVGRCLLRIIVGGAKCEFLGNLANQLSYSGLFLDSKPHNAGDLLVAMVFYYLYLYLNFSGFCDIAIGVAGLIGIRVKENFDNPFRARSIKEFWNRWHITLSEYVRDVIFTPLSIALARRFDRSYANAAIAISILVSFTVLGVWHGVAWRFLAFGVIQAVGLIANHYYTVWMKRWLRPAGYRRYNENRWVDAAALVVTFWFVAGSLFVFANDNYVLGEILKDLRAGLHVG